MAFPVYGSYATKEENPDADGSLTVNVPSHNAGDQLLLLSGHGRTVSSGTSGIVDSEPSGWTQLLFNKAEDNGRRLLSLWTKTADGGTVVEDEGFETDLGGWTAETNLARSTAEAHGGTYSVGTTVAINGAVTNRSLTKTIAVGAGGATLTYWANVNSNANYHRLELLVDGAVVQSTANTGGWSEKTYALAVGSRDIAFRWNWDSEDDEPEDFIYVDDINVTNSYETSVTIGYSETGKKLSARCQAFGDAGTIIAGTAKTSSGTSHDINTITGLTDGDYLGMWIGLGWNQPNNFSTQDNYLKTGISGGGQGSISAYTFATEFSGTEWNPSGFSTNFNRPYVLIGLAIPGTASSSSIIPLIQDEI